MPVAKIVLQGLLKLAGIARRRV